MSLEQRYPIGMMAAEVQHPVHYRSDSSLVMFNAACPAVRGVWQELQHERNAFPQPEPICHQDVGQCLQHHSQPAAAGEHYWGIIQGFVLRIQGHQNTCTMLVVTVHLFNQREL